MLKEKDLGKMLPLMLVSCLLLIVFFGVFLHLKGEQQLTLFGVLKLTSIYYIYCLITMVVIHFIDKLDIGEDAPIQILIVLLVPLSMPFFIVVVLTSFLENHLY
jgi:hypothetical protein